MLDVRGLLELYTQSVLLHRASYSRTLRTIHNPVFMALSDRAVDALVPLDLARWFQSIAATPAQSNRAFKVLRAAYRWGKKLRLLSCEFPDPGVPYYREQDRDRVLSAQERDVLLAGLDQMPVKLRAFLLVLWLCGPRPCELCRMRWADVDLVRATWHKPTTKNGRPHTVPLPQQAVINHHSLQYTHRYARVQLDPLRQAVQARADRLLPGQFQLEYPTTDQGGGPCAA